MPTKTKKANKSSVGWNEMSNQEIWDLLKTAPKIADKWKDSSDAGLSGEDLAADRYDANGECVINICRAFGSFDEYQIDFCSGLLDYGDNKYRTRYKTIAAAKKVADKMMKKDGWLLLD